MERTRRNLEVRNGTAVIAIFAVRCRLECHHESVNFVIRNTSAHNWWDLTRKGSLHTKKICFDNKTTTRSKRRRDAKGYIGVKTSLAMKSRTMWNALTVPNGRVSERMRLSVQGNCTIGCRVLISMPAHKVQGVAAEQGQAQRMGNSLLYQC